MHDDLVRLGTVDALSTLGFDQSYKRIVSSPSVLSTHSATEGKYSSLLLAFPEHGISHIAIK